MLYGIISDIHSNLEALQSVLVRLEGAVDQIVCLGDIVGYGPNPNECCELLQKKNIPTVRGNHDSAVCGYLETKWFNDNAKIAVAINRDLISSANLDYLRHLPHVLDFDLFQIVHASLHDYLQEYINNLNVAILNFALMAQKICFISHTHKPLVIYEENNADYGTVPVHGEEDIYLGYYGKVFVNVGSVGQPRDRDNRAMYAIYDDIKEEVLIRRVKYDINATQVKMQRLNLPQFLIERLPQGK